MERECIELVGSVSIEKDVEDKIKHVGVKGMDMQKANELGYFLRISNLLCASHAGITAAYRIYSIVDHMLTSFGARRNDISKAMNEYEKAFIKFTNFWTSYYANEESGVMMNRETENLYHRLMEWAQLPEVWMLGDEQRVKADSEVAIRLEHDDDVIYFRTTDISLDNAECEEECWCVTKYNTKYMNQETVETEMDKASAMMVAKRLSAEDADNIYTASVIQKRKEERTVLVPFRAYCGSETKGKITKLEK